MNIDCKVKRCVLQHKPTPHNLHHCLYFLDGKCDRPECRFLHREVDAKAGACQEFATFGYCQMGSRCESVHVRVCPSWNQTGECGHPTCKLVQSREKEKVSNSDEEEWGKLRYFEAVRRS